MGNESSSPTTLHQDSASQNASPTLKQNSPTRKNVYDMSPEKENFHRSQTIQKEEARTTRLLAFMEATLSLKEDWQQIIKERFRVNVILEGNGEIKTLASKQKNKYENIEEIPTLDFQATAIKQKSLTEREHIPLTDDKRVSFSGTHNYPSSVHGVVKVDNGDGVFYWGSGILVADDIVLTAAHNIYYKNEGSSQQFKNIQFIPGMNGKQAPFGAINIIDAYVPKKFLDTWDKENYGILMLEKSIGEQTGYFGLHAVLPYVLESKKIAHVGYPSDKVKERPGAYEQWGFEEINWWSDQNERNESEGVLEYQEVTHPGQDGGGVFYYDTESNDYYVVGVHIGGRFTETDTIGQATLITSDRLNQILQWTFNAKRRLLFKKSKTLDFAELDLANKKIGDEGINIMLACSIPNLKKANLSCNSITDGPGESFESASQFKNLEEFSIAGNRIGSRFAESIGKISTWKDLKILSLNSNRIGDDGTIALASNTTWNNLEGLFLSSNKIGDKGAEAIGNNQTWKNLKRLSLYSNNIGDDGVVAISANILWKNLEELSLDSNQIGDIGATAIGNNKTWTKLMILLLGTNKIGDDGASVIGQNTTWTNLEMLHLYHNQIGNKGATTLGENKTWRNLKMLLLGGNLIGTEGAAVLENNIGWTSLREVNLSKNPIRDITWKTNKWQNLKVISLYNCEISDEGAVSLGEDKTWTTLEILYIQGNKIGDKGATSIGSNTTWKQLRMLIINSNHIGDAGATALSNNKTWTNLEILWLNSNQIRDEGAAAIAKNDSWVNLKTLCLQINTIGDQGAAALGANTAWVNLKELNLSSNNIGDQGAEALAANEAWKNLESLRLAANWYISEKGKQALKENKVFGGKCKL